MQFRRKERPVWGFDGDVMRVKDAIVYRLQTLCSARHIRYNELAVRSGVTPSTVYSLMQKERQDISVTTVKKLCDGLDISIAEFFDDVIFRELEQEIQ